MNSNEILKTATETLLSESKSIADVINYLDADFVASVEFILKTTGKTVVCGIGKSALIAQKMVATFNSTGTPSVFLHAAEAMHGDLGMVQPDDVVICISKSGNSPEIKLLIPHLIRNGNVIIGITANKASFLAKNSTKIIHAYTESESCPNNLAPTNSTTVQLALGDALAVCLMKLRNFTADDFAKYHPGGALGKKLLLKISDCLEPNHNPQVSPETDIKKAIFEISEKRLGVTAVVENEKVIGIITDGDIRRMLSERDSLKDVLAKDSMTKNPKTIQVTNLVSEALDVLENNSITQLVVLEGEKYIGIIHLHDILKEGIL